LDWLDRLTAKKGIVGIEVLPDGLALVAKGCNRGENDIDVLSMLNPEVSGSDLNSELANFVEKQKIAKRLCHLILSSKDYQLLLVEAPEVPAEELRDAVKWRIKDLISMPVEQAVIDVFELPSDASRSSKKMLYAVVSELSRIHQLIDMVNASGLTLASIDIGEMAMRNIAQVLQGSGSNDRGVGIVRVVAGGGSVSLYKEGNLYLSRQFQLNYSGGLLDDLPTDALALEVQRSLDYYERQMGMTPPGALYMCGENVSADKITLDFTRSLTVPARMLDLGEAIGFAEQTDDGMVQLCIGALGGSLRSAGGRQ